MSLVEAMRLVRILAGDPSSALAASVAGWEFSLSREAWLLMDLYDLAHQWMAGKRVDPHPWRPNAKRGDQQQFKMSTGGRSREEMIAILAQYGPKPASSAEPAA